MFPLRLPKVAYYNLHRLNRQPCILGFATMTVIYQLLLLLLILLPYTVILHNHNYHIRLRYINNLVTTRKRQLS